MTVKVYLLIETEDGDSKNVVRRLGEIEGVKTADVVDGPYNVIAIAESDSLDELGIMVIERIPYIRGVSRTITCFTVVGS